jgi:hypothetical protein
MRGRMESQNFASLERESIFSTKGEIRNLTTILTLTSRAELESGASHCVLLGI